MSIRKISLLLIFLFCTVAFAQAYHHFYKSSFIYNTNESSGTFPGIPIVADTAISGQMMKMNSDSILLTIKYLQSFDTRYYNTPQAFTTQDWLAGKLKMYGYDVDIQNVPTFERDKSSGNVIATLRGTEFPEEYIVLGAHYDTYTKVNRAPGADDNASGTAGILEIARVLAGKHNKRSLVLCFWAAEEIGCKGSAAFVSQAVAKKLKILAYLNLDMCGYQVGDHIHANVIFKRTSKKLAKYYIGVCAIYLPEFQLIKGGKIPGTSDYSSFNAAAYQGIFPFEDVHHYSPFMHTSEDLLGNSVNNIKMVQVFSQSLLVTALEMVNSEW